MKRLNNAKDVGVFFVSPGNAQLQPIDPPPPLKPGQVKLKSLFSLVSTGTELAYLLGKHHEIQQGKFTFPMGARGAYSLVGEIVDKAPDVIDCHLGQRVVAMSGHRSSAVVDAAKLTPVPDNITSRQAAFIMVGIIALHGVRIADIQFGQTVLVTGQGLIGQLAGQIARIMGAARVIVTDISQTRLDMAIQNGAAAALQTGRQSLADIIKARQNEVPEGIHTAIESSGNPHALRDALETVNDDAVISLLGCPHDPVTLDLYTHLQKRQLHLIGAYQPKCPETLSGTRYVTRDINKRLIFQWVADRSLNVDSLLNDIVAPTQVNGLYTRLISQDASIAGGIDWTKLPA